MAANLPCSYLSHLFEASQCRLSVRRAWEQWLVAALFNWTEAPQPITFDPSSWDIPGLPYHLYDLWSGEHWGPVNGPVELGLTSQHGVRLLSVHADCGRPQLVGSTLHLLGGPVELAGESWANNNLALDLACPGEREGRLVVYSPPGFAYERVAAHGLREEPIVQQNGRLVTLDLRFTDQARNLRVCL